jgi:hypothetical protein
MNTTLPVMLAVKTCPSPTKLIASMTPVVVVKIINGPNKSSPMPFESARGSPALTRPSPSTAIYTAIV